MPAPEPRFEDQKRTSWNEDGRRCTGPEMPIGAGPPLDWLSPGATICPGAAICLGAAVSSAGICLGAAFLVRATLAIETEVANIVSQVTACSDFLQVSGSEFKSRDLERESRHLVSLELHSITIAEYIKTQRIPRGLHVSLLSTLFQDNSEFCSKF
ncbi:unnamed protein product [Ranitomeya imitator]|uniref:ATP synthase protein MI25 n=1 Tax=Ranitomeya imitator TaxID=111125 RepID=A0ABN9MME8_9NEOB|nr:unnamed protein product [Ranitomeya imitator]